MLKIGEADVFPDEDAVRRDGTTITMTPKSMDVLVHLAEHAGETISAERLLQAVWQTDFIADNAVHKAISEIRRALGDDSANPRYIRTVRQRGYRLVAPVAFAAQDGPARTTRSHRLGFVAAIATAAALIVGFFSWYFIPSLPPPADPLTIAVLPFADMSPAGDQAHLADGLAEELIVTLAQTEELEVVARTSAFAFKDKQADVREIAKGLGVGSIVEGSVRTDGNRLRITAQLIRASDGYQLWSGRFDRASEDVFAIQDEIANAVASALRVELRLAAATPDAGVEFRVFELKKLGDYFLNKGDEESLRRALDYYTQVITITPTYSGAYVGIALAHMAAWWTGSDTSDERRRRFVEAAERALTLGPDNAAALSVDALTKMFDFEWAGAKRSLDQALSMAPKDANVIRTGVLLSQVLGDAKTALRLALRAVELDPLNPNNQFLLGIEYASRERWPEAAERLQRAVQLGGGSSLFRYDLAYAYHRLGRDAEALDVLLDLDMPPSFAAQFKEGYKDGGYKGALRQVVTVTSAGHTPCRGSAWNMAVAYSILGEVDAMYRCLDQAVEQRRAFAITIVPSMAPYRDQPRFKSVLSKMNLPSY